jgi:hypothetical protein
MSNCWFRRALFLGLGSLLSLATALSGQSLNCLGTTASDNPAARDEIDKGVESYKSARYGEAISHFEKATSLAPCLTMARSYLATAQAQNVVPGLSTPDNLRIADQSIANFHIVLTQDPHDINSLKQVAGIFSASRNSTMPANGRKKSWLKILETGKLPTLSASSIGHRRTSTR